MVLKKIVNFLCCFILCIRDFIKKFCKTMIFFKKKLRYLKSKITTKFHGLLFAFFIFLVFFTFFFCYFTCLWFSKNCKIFVLFYCMDPTFYQIIEIFEIQNFNKIPSFTISFLFFLAFLAFCFLSPIETYPKMMEFFVVFYWKG